MAVTVFSTSTSGRSISAQSDESVVAMPLVTDAVFHTPPPWSTTVPHVERVVGDCRRHVHHARHGVGVRRTTEEGAGGELAGAGPRGVADEGAAADGDGSDAAHAPPVTPAGSAAAVSLRVYASGMVLGFDTDTS